MELAGVNKVETAMRVRFLTALVSCLLGVAACAEDEPEPPPFDAPEPTPPPRIVREEPEAPGAAFDATRSMRSRKDIRAKADAAKRAAENELSREAITAALDGLRLYQIELFKLDGESAPEPEIDRSKHRLVKGGTFLGWKILERVELDGEGSFAARKLVTDQELHDLSGAGCFTPGMGLQWTDAYHSYSALVCLSCRRMRFVLPERVVEIPLSDVGRIAGAKLFQKTFPDDDFRAWLEALELRRVESEAKKRGQEDAAKK